MKTLAQQITELQTALASEKDKLVEATKLLETDPTPEMETAVVELTDNVEKMCTRLENLKRAELALGKTAAPVEKTVDSPAVIHPAIKTKDAENLYGKLALCTYDAKVKGVSVEQIAESRFKGNEALAIVIKAAQNPAMTTVPGYAQDLLTMGFGQFMDILRAESVLTSATPLMQQHVFNGFSSIAVPYRKGTELDAAGVWRAEGAPVPVKSLQFGGKTLTPKNLGVILTATEEMLQRSSIDLAAYFQDAMAKDTGAYVDMTFLDATAGSTIRPAGIRFGGTAASEFPASGTGTANDILTDIKKMLTAQAKFNMGGASQRFIMSKTNWYTVQFARTATGAPYFPEAAQGNIAGVPVIVSQHIPDTSVLLVDFAQITCAFGAPVFLTSNVATLHEENAAPLPLVDGAGVVAKPARSLFQTFTVATRMNLPADWEFLRDDGIVIELTAVAWVG
jgi:HK97 family phage major capsid protein